MKNTLSSLFAAAVATLALTCHAAPTVNLSAPANGGLYLSPTNITLQASASAEAGRSLVRVEFYTNGLRVGSASVAPYKLVWSTGEISGDVAVTAKAIDSAGEQTMSAPRTLTFNQTNVAPTVSLTQPPNNARYNMPIDVTLAVSVHAPETNDSITRVEYFLNGISTGIVTASPWRLNLSNVQPGTYTLIAAATDAQGASTASASRTFTIQAANTPPTVNLTSPPNNSSYIQPITLDLKANAASPETNGSVTKVEFYANGQLIGTDTNKPYGISVSTLAPGTYALTAKATDDLGAETISAVRTVTINATNAPPTVSIAMPANNAHYNDPADVEVRVNAGAPETNDAVQKVELYQDGVLVATLTSVPYITTLPQLPVGRYVLTAIATDSQGAQTTSNPRTVIVTFNNRPPTVSLTTPVDNSTAPIPGTVTISANANPREVNGSITQVEFLVNGVPVAVDLDKPYSVTWVPTQLGVYTLTARATDNLGGVTTSAARTITVAQRVSDAKLYYIHVDHLNIPRASTNDQQQVVWRWDQQEPFGVNVPDENPSGLGAFELPMRFPGQYFDRETTLAYNLARTYDAAVGRYLQSDPIGLDGGENTYLYSDASPLTVVDPSGLSPIKLIKLCIKGFKEVRNISFKEAVKIAKNGGGDIKASSHAEARKIAKAASQGKKAIRDPAHPDRATGSTEGRRPHYHPNPRTGSHIFYGIAAALTLPNYSSCTDCTEETLLEVLDFFNPLSAPQDIIDIVDEFR